MTPAARYALKVLGTACAVAAVLYWQRGRLLELPVLVGQLHVGWLLASAGCNALGTIVVPACVTLATGDRFGMSLWELVRINFALRIYSLVLPKGAVAVLRFRRYRTTTSSSDDAFALVVFEKLALFFVYLLGGCVFLVVELPRLPSGGALLAAMAVVTGLWAVLLLPFLWRDLAPLMRAGTRWLAARLPGAVGRRLETLGAAVIAFQGMGRRRVLLVLVWSTVSYGFFVLSAVTLAFAMDLRLTLAAVGWMRAAVFVMTFLPLTVGGLGVREAGYVGLMGLYGVDAAAALAFGLSLFGIQVALGVVGAVIDLCWGAWANEA